MQRERRSILEQCARSLQFLVDDYIDSAVPRCKNQRKECDAMLLGSLVRGLVGADLMPPFLQVQRYSINMILQKLRDLELVDYCSMVKKKKPTDDARGKKSLKKTRSPDAPTRECRCDDRIASIQTHLSYSIEGFKLKDMDLSDFNGS